MTAKRFRYDTGCFIDMQENKVLSEIQATNLLNKLVKENEQLKKDIKQIHTYIDNAILTERTRMGKNCLKQLKEGLQ